jgi:hypothetical protein
MPKSGQNVLSTTDYEILSGTQEDPRKSITFVGCNHDKSLGKSPKGKLYIAPIRTQK